MQVTPRPHYGPNALNNPRPVDESRRSQFCGGEANRASASFDEHIGCAAM